MKKVIQDWTELPDFGINKEMPDNHVSFLLGAGFSVNMGYPIASNLNEKIEKINPELISIDSEQNLFFLEEGQEDPNWFYPSGKQKFFIRNLIDLFLQSNDDFDYEEFYDFITEEKFHEKPEFKKLCSEFRKEYKVPQDEKGGDYGNRQLLSKTIKILNQLIERFLVDGEGKNFYYPSHLGAPFPREYSGVLSLMQNLGQDYVVHVHSLNHDLLFETFQHTDYLIDGGVSDGFDELGSDYYGEIRNGRKVRLRVFCDSYGTIFRLYKLHGSLYTFPFKDRGGSVLDFVKRYPDVRTSNIYKEIKDSDGRLTYFNDFTNYHADFLSGTTRKIQRYGEEGYFKKVFEHFEENLKKSNKLIIVGYGCRDSEINKMIVDNFDFKNRPVFIVDPFPSEHVKSFAAKIGAKIIEKTPDHPLLEDIG